MKIVNWLKVYKCSYLIPPPVSRCRCLLLLLLELVPEHLWDPHFGPVSKHVVVSVV